MLDIKLHFVQVFSITLTLPVPVDARSKAWVCGRSLVRIAGSNTPPPGTMGVCCDGCVLSSRGLCVGLITRPESPTECGVSECYIETSIMRGLSLTRGCSAMGGQN